MKIQMKLVTTYNKNEQQQGGKNNAELQTEWRKTTWKAFEETRRGRNKSLKAWLVTDDDDSNPLYAFITLMCGWFLGSFFRQKVR